MFGPVAMAVLGTIDMTAPGAPGLVARQLSNSQGEYTVTPPTLDADLSPLTGLTHGEAAVIQAGEDEAAFYLDHFEALLQPGVAQVTRFELEPGSPPITIPFVIGSPGKPYAVLARCADHPLSDSGEQAPAGDVPADER